MESWQGKAWSNKRVRGRLGWGLGERNWESWLDDLSTNSEAALWRLSARMLVECSFSNDVLSGISIAVLAVSLQWSEEEKEEAKVKFKQGGGILFEMFVLQHCLWCYRTCSTSCTAQPPAPGSERCASMATALRPLQVSSDLIFCIVPLTKLLQLVAFCNWFFNWDWRVAFVARYAFD